MLWYRNNSEMYYTIVYTDTVLHHDQPELDLSGTALCIIVCCVSWSWFSRIIANIWDAHLDI